MYMKGAVKHLSDYRFALGIDPSLDGTGFAVIDLNYKVPRLVEKGVVKGRTKTWGSTPRGVKLKLLEAEMNRLKAKYYPLYPTIFMEKGFSRFKTETQSIYRARGVIENVFWDMDIEEIAPTSVKKIVTGNGSAGKDRVALAVKEFYDVEDFETDDESDALAVIHAAYLTTIRGN